ncbi:MAG: LCP family protein [Propionibacteriaceae bacterium]|jgi:LCP family protein required for cell wall assembly|nr:LCP family protein [Propionibacteriaceae bacterium]
MNDQAIVTADDWAEPAEQDPAPAPSGVGVYGIIGRVLGVVACVTVAALGWTVWNSGVVPTTWFVIGVGALTAVALLVTIGLWSVNHQRHPVGYTLLVLLAVLGIIVNLVGSSAARNVTNLFEGIQAPQTLTDHYDVIALKTHDPDVASLAGQAVAQLSTDAHKAEVTEKLAEIVSVNLGEVSDPGTLAQQITDGTLDGAVINSAYRSIYEDGMPEFYESIQILTTFDITYEAPTPTPEPEPAPDATTEERGNPAGSFIVYVSGVDVAGSITATSRSDSNILIVVNPTAGKILMVNTPRDFYVQLHGTTGLKDKLTHAGIYGVDMSVSTLEDLYGVHIDDWIRVNFTSLVELVDTLGGITVDSAYDFTCTHGGYHFSVGPNDMNGTEALCFSRTRYAFAEGDRIRGENQERVIEGILKKMLDPSVLPRYASILDTLSGMMQTSMPTDRIAQLANNQLSSGKGYSFDLTSVTGSDAYAPTYSFGAQDLYVMIPDQGSVAIAKQRIEAVYYAMG